MKINGSGVLNQYSCQIGLRSRINVDDLQEILGIPESLSSNLIIVRDHRKLGKDDIINEDDEIFLFLVVMGG